MGKKEKQRKARANLKQNILPEFENGVGEAEVLEAIGLAVGAASMCWESMMGTGQFDEGTASRLVDELHAIVQRYGQNVAKEEFITEMSRQQRQYLLRRLYRRIRHGKELYHSGYSEQTCPGHSYQEAGSYINGRGQKIVRWLCKRCPASYERPSMG